MKIARKLKLALWAGVAITVGGFLVFAAGYRLVSSTRSVPDLAGALTFALLPHLEDKVPGLHGILPESEMLRLLANFALPIGVWSTVAFVIITLWSALTCHWKLRAQRQRLDVAAPKRSS